MRASDFLVEYDIDTDKKKKKAAPASKFGGRKLKDPDVTGYEEVPVKKTEPENIDSVIAYVKGSRSAKLTKIARELEKAVTAKKELTDIESKLKDDIRIAVDDLFDAGDEIYSRIVDTASLTFKVAKAESRTTEKLDEQGFLDELAALTGLAVDQLETIKNKHLKLSTTKVSPKVLTPKEKKPAKESVYEGMFDSAKRYASAFKQKLMSFLGKWDRKFQTLEAKIESQI